MDDEFFTAAQQSEKLSFYGIVSEDPEAVSKP